MKSIASHEPTAARSNELLVPTPDAHRACLVKQHSPTQTAKLAWTDQLSSWGRFALPLSESSPNQSLFQWPAELRYPLATKLKVINGEELDSSLSHVAELHWSTAATFGQVLFPYHEHLSLKEPWQDVHERRAFVPTMPCPSGFAGLRLEAAVSEPTTTLVLRFDPRPASAAAALASSGSNEQAPVMELHIRLRNAAHKGPIAWEDADKELHVIHRTHTQDVVLPGSPVDARITQQLAASLAIDDADAAALPRLAGFLERADLNLTAGRLLTPPYLALDLPLATAGGSDTDNQRVSAIDGQSGEGASTTAPVLYDFSGLEVRRRVQVPYRNYILRYESIEAGLSGGRRAELSYHVLPVDDDGVSPSSHVAAEAGAWDQNVQGEYLREVRDIAMGSAFPWLPDAK